MTDVSEFKGKGNWYEIDGLRFNGEKLAIDYVEDRDAISAPEEEEKDTTADDSDDEIKVKPVVAETKPEAQEFLVQSMRDALLFEIRGPSGKLYRFKRASPILLVLSEDVETILGQDMFRMVSPDMAKEFYS
jgi:hypothetical protein